MKKLFALIMACTMVLAGCSSGSTTAEKAAATAKEMGLLKVDVFVKGPGAGRENAIRALNQAGLEVLSITDTSPVAHNGCRPPKRRRK